MIFSYPNIVGGIIPVTPASAWGYSIYYPLVGRVNEDVKLLGFTFQVQNVPSADVTNEMLFEIARGYQGEEVTIIQAPYSFRSDTNVGYYMIRTINVFFPEPVLIKEGTRLSVRMADQNSSSITYHGFKIMYDSGNIPFTENNLPNNFKFSRVSNGMGVTEGWR